MYLSNKDTKIRADFKKTIPLALFFEIGQKSGGGFEQRQKKTVHPETNGLKR